VHRLSLVSVNVGTPRYLGQFRGQPVQSAIAKSPVAEAVVHVDRVNLEGDGQADLTVHGGAEMAVYAYPARHLPTWSQEFGRTLGPAAFGENLTVADVDEDTVRIGDRWRWGEAVLEVCQPRWPCFKLAMHTGVGDIVRRMRTNGRTGWYLRVVGVGAAPTAGPIEVVPDPEGITVRDAHIAASPSHSAPAELARAAVVARHPALADGWREQIHHRLSARGAGLPEA
jgi:MOSC domain-containing protein YiiM